MGIRFYVIIISAYSFLERHVESDSMYIRFYVIIKSTGRPVVDISCPRSAQIPTKLEKVIPRPEEKNDIFTNTLIFVD